MTSRNRLIPNFLSGDRIIPHAMIDHVELAFGDWPVLGPAQQVLRFLDAIKGIRAVTKHGESIPFIGTSERSNNAGWLKAEISTGRPGNVTYQTRPTFGGFLTSVAGKPRVPQQTPGEHIRLGVDAHLNINQFLMSQTVLWEPLPDSTWLQTPLATAIECEAATYGSEYCLTDDVNLIIGPDPIYRYALSKPAEDHFMDCLDLSERFMTSELRDTAHAYGLHLDHSPYYSLRKIEFVWEFSHPNPIRFVEGLELAMRALGPQTTRHRAMVRGERIGVHQDSFAVTTEMSSGCNLTVYAKTNRRIRIEIRVYRDSIAGMLRGGRGDASRTAANHGELRGMIRTLRLAATEQMQFALTMLDRQRVPPASDVTALQLCAQVGRILQNDELAKTVLETLRLRGSLASAQGLPLKMAAKKLEKATVLRRLRPRSPVFVPTAPFVRAVGELRRIGARQGRAAPRRAMMPIPALPPRGIVRRRNWPGAGRN